MQTSNPTKFKFFIGIDVSKLTLDVVVKHNDNTLSHKMINNELFAIVELFKEMKSIKGLTLRNSLFGMESSGVYCNHLQKFLSKIKANYVVENPLHIKKSLGLIRGKTDKMDAERIANYLFKSKHEIKLKQPKRQVIQRLASLTTLRNRMIALRLALNTPLKEDLGFVDLGISHKNLLICRKSLEALKSDIEHIETTIKEIWQKDKKLNRLMEIITSVPSVGEITALKIVLTTNEFKDITSAKKFASYAGVAPFPFESGISVRGKTKTSRIANIKMKALLHTCAISAKRYSPDMKAYFERKTEIEGKHKMSVFNAIRFKLILRVFACVNGDRLYEKSH